MFGKIIENLEQFAQKNFDHSLQAQIAQELDWTLVSGKNAALAKPVITLATDADKAGAEVLEDSEKYEKEKSQYETSFAAFEAFPGASLFAKMVQVVCGKMEGQDVYIFPGSEGGGQNSSGRRKLDIILLLKSSLDLKLHMYPEFWYSKVGKFLFRLQDIHVGDERIDEAFMIKAKDQRAVQQLLRAEEVRAALYQLFEDKFELPIVNDVSIRNTIYLPSNPQPVIRHMQRLARLGILLNR